MKVAVLEFQMHLVLWGIAAVIVPIYGKLLSIVVSRLNKAGNGKEGRI